MPDLKNNEEDIAIVGMACRFAGAADLEAYWNNILASKCAISEHPSPDAQRVLDPDSPHFERAYTIRGGFLKELARFDPMKHGIMPDALRGNDPDHFLALDLAAEALDDAGYGPNRAFPNERTQIVLGHGTYANPSNVNWVQHGVVLDQTMDLVRKLLPQASEEQYDALHTQLRDNLPPIDSQTITGLIPNILTGRIANRLDIMGSNYVIDAACASSLIAIDNCVSDLRRGVCDLALTGGIQGCLSLLALMAFCRINAMTRGDAPHPFSADAQGTLLAEGAGVMVLKRLKDAERDGDRIYACIKGVGIASDGRAKGLLAPRLEGEAKAIERAYTKTGIDTHTVDLIEAHGTGIPLGDQTELQALTQVFGPRHEPTASCAIGSVKSMIGHCIPAAGAAGVIKTALALYHKVLPPTINCPRPHPALEIDKTPFYINTEVRPWVQGRARPPRRAAVSAMGFGGINSHCILEAHPDN